MIFVDYPGHLAAALLLGAFAGLVFLAFRLGELQNEKLRRYRMPLLLLQYASILILLLILWNPSQTRMSETLSSNSVLTIFDTSESMSVVEDGQSTRLDKALDIFEEKFRPTDDDGTGYKIFGFDSESYHSGSSDFLRRWGSQTELHGVFSTLGKYDITDAASPTEATRRPGAGTPDYSAASKSRATGAIIFTDGQADDKNIDAYVALVDKGFQTVLVGVGSRDRQADIAVTAIDAPARMAIDTACRISVTVAARDLSNEPVTVELLKDDYVIESREIPAGAFAETPGAGDPSGKSTTLEFAVGADRLGSHAYSARAASAEPEINRANNVRSTMIEVVEETRLKVLFYSQVANFNVGKVRQALARDSKIQLDLSLDIIRKSELAEKASNMCGYVKLPNDRRGFYEYDVIVLGPCDMAALTNAQIDGLYRFVVDRGGGLILLPGKVELGPATWTSRKARALVPVVFDIDEPTIWPSSPDKIELTLEGIDTNIIGTAALEDYDEPTLPYYRIPFSKPASTTLASINDTPVVSIHRVGRGRVCLLNAAKLYRWYREDLQGGLLSRTMAGLTAYMGRITNREAGIELFAERPAGQADRVKFQAYVCDDSFKPVAGANVLLSVADQVLSMNHTGRGYYVAELKGTAPATVATAQAEVDGVFLGERTIAVNLPTTRTEMTDTNLDEEFLQALAKKINAEYVHIDDVDERIAQMFEARAGVISSRRMTSIWPNWLVLAVLCTLVCLGWFLRRSIGLV